MSIEHYVFLVFPKDKVNRELKDNMAELLKKAKDELKLLEEYAVVFTDNDNMQTVGAVIHLRFPSQTVLEEYLKHPLHLKLLAGIKPLIVHKDAFDWESA